MRVRMMTRADLSGVVDAGVAAFQDDELFVWLSPKSHQYPSGWRAYLSARMKLKICTPGSWGVVCVDDTDRVLGYAWWTRMVPDSTPELRKTDPWLQNNRTWSATIERAINIIEAKYDALFKINRAMDHAGIHFLRNDDDPLWDPLDKATTHWHLEVLGVAPWAQRKGVGAALIDWGFDQAREEMARTGVQVPLTLTASPNGHGLYTKKGFKVVGWQRMVLDETRTVPLRGGAAFVWDPTWTWITEAPPGSEVKKGRPVNASWSEKTLQAAS